MREVIKIEKKSRILDAAALLFSRKQYHEVMIEDVAKLASIAKGTVYNYFSSKEDIYFSIMLERMDTLITSLDAKIKSDPGSRNALESFVLHLYSFMMKYQDFFLMYRRETLNAENQLCSKIARMQNQLLLMLKDIISAGVEENIFRKIDESFAADLILGSIYASVNRGIENNYTENEKLRERSETFNFIYEGMSAHKEDLPLKGRTIVLTRTDEKNRESAVIFEQAGGVVFSLPVIKIEPLDKREELKSVMLSHPDYLVLTSANAVKIFMDQVLSAGINIPAGTKIAAVGNKTAAECRKFDLQTDIIPLMQNAEGLIEFFRNIEVRGKKFLIPRASEGREEFINFLKSGGAEVSAIDIYNTVKSDRNEISDKLITLYEQGADVIVFASPSAVKNFLEVTGFNGAELLKNIKIASIGTSTSNELVSFGFKPAIEAGESSMEGLRNSITDFFNKEKQ